MISSPALGVQGPRTEADSDDYGGAQKLQGVEIFGIGFGISKLKRASLQQ